ncbi:MAG: HupE/UreJ family protein [Candidatus Competibacteraceae bacterium]|nr:HupE/UreJ family protein [Candidatus Competibacteraceae bacterium]
MDSPTLYPRIGMALGLTLSANVAHAHVASAQAGAFYAGLLHPLTAPEHVLPMVALGLLAGQQGLNQGQGVLLVFPAAMALGASLALLHPALEWVSLLNIGSAALFGGLVAAAWRAPAVLLYALALLFGMSHGYANGAAITPNLSPAVFIVGLVTAALLVLGYSMAGTAYLLRLQPAWLPIAVRVAGSWIAAVGILVFGMMVRGQ